MLTPHRVLDLSTGGYLICGQILADLGTNVVLAEPPNGRVSWRQRRSTQHSYGPRETATSASC